MSKKLIIPICAGFGLVLAVVVAFLGGRKPPVPPLEYPPPTPPYQHYVAGSGIIEASSLNVNLGTPVAGIVEEVFVQPGDIVPLRAPLFRVDTRDLVAAQKEAEASKMVAKASLQRLVAQPRLEEVPVLEARVAQAKIRLSDEFTQYELFQSVSDKRAISRNEFNQRKFAAGFAKYQLAQSQAALDLLNAGAWIEDIKIASEELGQAQASFDLASTLLERATVRAPFEGLVMQVNINQGDFARGSREDTIFQDPLMVFGQVDPLHVRVDVDEDDAWRIYPNARAMGYVRGNSQIQFPLHFVRIEPYVIPKRSLTGENFERVDTRVLQLIYRFDKGDLPLYVGQLLDIYVESRPSHGL